MSGVLVVCLFAAAVVAGTPARTEAAHALKLTSGSDVVVLHEGDMDDDCPDNGCILFMGSLGTFNISITTGLSLGGPTLDLNSVNLSSSSGGTLVIEHTDTNFTGSGPALMAVGGNVAAGGSLTYSAYWGDANTEFAKTNEIAPSLTFSGSPFSGEVLGGGPSGSYSLTQVVTIVHAGKGKTGFDAELTVQVPEPATVLLQVVVSVVLLGLTMSTLGTTRRRARVSSD